MDWVCDKDAVQSRLPTITVVELVDWVNEIHTWGLSQYGPSCEQDIKGVLNFGVRTSDVHEQLLDRIVSINGTSSKFL